MSSRPTAARPHNTKRSGLSKCCGWCAAHSRAPQNENRRCRAWQGGHQSGSSLFSPASSKWATNILTRAVEQNAWRWLWHGFCLLPAFTGRSWVWSCIGTFLTGGPKRTLRPRLWASGFWRCWPRSGLSRKPIVAGSRGVCRSCFVWLFWPWPFTCFRRNCRRQDFLAGTRPVRCGIAEVDLPYCYCRRSFGSWGGDASGDAKSEPTLRRAAGTRRYPVNRSSRARVVISEARIPIIPDMAAIQVRPAQVADIPQLVALMTDFYAEGGYPLPAGPAARTFTQLLGDPRLGRVWVMECDNLPVGHVVLTLSFSM